MRTFISIEIPEEVKSAIFHEFEKLKNTGLVSGNFTKKENLHLTLKFLGELSEEQTEKIKSSLHEIDFSQFSVKTGEVGAFPNKNYVRVLWVKLESLVEGKFFDLKKVIDENLEKIGIPEEKKEFNSHITVARIKSVKDKKLFRERVDSLKVKEKEFRVKNISLVKSELRREGPFYKTLEEFSLK